MKAWLKKIFAPPQRRSLNLPAPPMAPPPFLGGSGLGGRGRQLAAYQGWVYTAVSAIAGRVSSVDLRLLRATETGPGPQVTRHPLIDLLARPNPIMTRRELTYTLVSHLELTGMAFCLVCDNALGMPAELWPLSPADLQEIESGPDTRRAIEAFRFTGPDGQMVRYRPEEILYFRHPSPNSLIYGASPIEAMAHAYDIDLAVRVYQHNFFKNAARPEVVLSTENRLTEQEARRILTRWTQKHQGLAHVFEPTLLDGGLTATPLTFSAKDFEFLALAGWTQDNILAAYQVPAGKLGLVKDLNRANAFAVDVTFNTECIKPRLDMISEVFNTFLLPRFGDDLVLAFDNPIPTDRAAVHQQTMDRLDRGVVTINEARADLGKEPVTWGDEPYNPMPPMPGAAPGALPGAAPSPQPSAGPTDASTLASKVYKRLQARYAGWSAAKVADELGERPELLAELDEGSLSPVLAATTRAVVTKSLTRGWTHTQMTAALTAACKEESK